jgi:hypothetical protein
MTLYDRKLLEDARQADKRARMATIAWRRKQLIERRYALEDQWQNLFPQHDFTTLRLINRAAMPAFDLSTFERLCDEAERKAKPKASTPRPTPRTVVEAVMLCIRERGVGALSEPENIRRLKQCDEAARAQIDARIERLKNRIGS